MQNQVTLRSVIKKLKLWRTNKPTTFAKIPQDIKNSIKYLGQHYSYKQLSKALNIYGASLTNIIKNTHNYNHDANKIDFIELPSKLSKPAFEKISNPVLTQTKLCTLRHSNGTTLTIEVSTQQLSSIIKDFVCCN